MSQDHDFRLYHSNALDVLAELLANELRTPARGQPLLAPEIVLIPQVAMRRWLQATLAQAHGIAANLEFLTPGEFVARALQANLGRSNDDLDADALHWRLYAALTDASVLREPALRPLRDYLRGDDPLKPWSLAGELAAVFEKYQAWRRDWLLDWERGAEPDDPQAALWRRIGKGRNHRARRLDEYLRRFAGEQAPELPRGLPVRVFAFATLNVSPDVLRVIASQSRVGTLHFYLPTPSASWWGDMSTVRERLRDGDALDFGPRENPLLERWGEAGRDFMAVLGGFEVVHPSGEFGVYADPETHRDDDPGADTLLQRLHRDLLHRRSPSPEAFRAAPVLTDASVQFHACHTRLREVQVLHDRLRALLDDPSFDPPLQPREIAVLAPDIDPYVAHVEAVFGGLRGQREFIAYALADTSPLASEPLAEVFLRLLALPISRFGLHEMLDLMATPALADAAGFDAPALDRLRDWFGEAGAYWGVDASHRLRHDAPADDAYTWSFALDRLLLGYASGSDEDIAGVAPWQHLEGGALDALDALLRLLRTLASHERLFGKAMTPAQWRERLLGLLDALLPENPRDPADVRALQHLRTAVESLAQAAARAGVEQAVPPDVVRAHFQAVLTEADTRAPLLTGGVSFGRMVPLRLLPFRVICVLGMNDGEYPRRDPAGGLNRLTQQLGTASRRHGDRSLREDDRFLFLQLLAAAGEVFYLSWLGADPRDGSIREPSVLVSELLDVAAEYHSDGDAARRALVLRHPLQPFAPEAFGVDDGHHDPRRFSYLRAWHPAAQSWRGVRASLPRWADGPLPALDIDEGELALDTLRRFLCDPADAFLRQRLHLRLAEVNERANDTEPLLPPPSGWMRQRLQRAVFDACVSDDLIGLAARLRARAWLPSGALGEQQLQVQLDEIRPYAQAFIDWRGDAAAQTHVVEAHVAGLRVHSRIADVHPHGLARLRFGELHGPSQIAHGLEWLLLAAAGQPRELVQVHAVGRDNPRVQVSVRPACAVEPAHDALARLIALRAQGLREPLPFAARSGWRWFAAKSRAGSKSPWQQAQEQWHSERGWSEGATDAVQLALRGSDPFIDPRQGERFREIADELFNALGLGSMTESIDA